MPDPGTVPVTTIDLGNPDFVEDPYPQLRELQDAGPVVYHRVLGGPRSNEPCGRHVTGPVAPTSADMKDPRHHPASLADPNPSHARDPIPKRRDTR